MRKRISVFFCLFFFIAGTAFAEKVDLKIAWWGSQVRHEATIKVVELYQKLNPNVSITYEFAGFDDYWTKMTTMAAGGQLPDVMQQDYSRIAEWQMRGLLEPLDPFVANKTLKLGGVAKPILDSGTLDGKLYALSLGSNSYSLMLDVDAFKKAGVALPAQDWTWQDFEKIAMQLHDKLGVWGIGGGFEVDELAWKANYLGLGQTIYTPDGKSLAYKDDKALVDFLNMMLRLVKAGAAPSYQEFLANLGGATGNVQLDAIVAGKAAIEAVWSNQVVTVATAAGAGRHFAVVHLPRQKKGGPASNFLKPSMFFSIPTQSKNKVEAAKFVDFFTNDVEANRILNAERGVPVDATVRAALAQTVSPVVKQVFEYIDRVAKDAAPTPPPEPAGHANIRQNVYVPLIREQVFYGVITPEEAAKELRDRAAAILAGK